MAELALDRRGVEASARGAKESPVGLEAVGRGGETERGDLRCDHAVLRRVPGVEGLRHRAEVLAQAARLRGTEGKRAARRLAIEAEELRGTRGRADRAAGP